MATLTRCRTGAGNAAKRRARAGRRGGRRPKDTASSRVPTYAAQAKAGKVDGFAKPALEWRRARGRDRDRRRERLCLSGDRLGARRRCPLPRVITASPRRRSRARIIAASSVIRSSGWRTQGLLALMFANTPGAIAPWGGAKAVFGTNPIAFACPLPGRPPIVVDLSLSKVRARQHPRGQAEGRDHSPRLGARCAGQADHRSQRPRLPAPCCRSATPKARRWR